MIKKLFALEEQDTITFACIAGASAAIFAYLVVMLLLDGVKEDSITLIIAVYCFFVYLVGKKSPKIANHLLACAPGLGSVVIVVSNTGHYSAIDQAYFLCLIVAIAHYDVFQILLSSGVVLVTNITGIIFFPEAYLKIHDAGVWLFVLFMYICAVICALVIAAKTHNLFEKERQIQLHACELTHMKQLEKTNEEHRQFIHNIHHYFSTIGNLATTQDYENILNILRDLNVEITKQESVVYTSHHVMNAILSEKYLLAESQHIPLDIYVEPNVRLANISDGDIIVMLGNLLDNALEAVTKTPEANRFLKVRIYHENNGRICVIKIENSFLTPIEYNKKGRILSNKKHGLHGFGLKSANQTAQKYGGYLECTHKDNIFTSILLLSESALRTPS